MPAKIASVSYLFCIVPSVRSVVAHLYNFSKNPDWVINLYNTGLKFSTFWVLWLFFMNWIFQIRINKTSGLYTILQRRQLKHPPRRLGNYRLKRRNGISLRLLQFLITRHRLFCQDFHQLDAEPCVSLLSHHTNQKTILPSNIFITLNALEFYASDFLPENHYLKCRGTLRALVLTLFVSTVLDFWVWATSVHLLIWLVSDEIAIFAYIITMHTKQGHSKTTTTTTTKL